MGSAIVAYGMIPQLSSDEQCHYIPSMMLLCWISALRLIARMSEAF
jgi:hypothetical protein